MLSLTKLPNPNQNSNPTITIHKRTGRRISRVPVDADGVVWVRISALYVRAGAPVAQVITAHLDGEVVVPPALAVVGVLRAAAEAPVSASAPAPASASASAATVAAARRAGAGTGAGHGARWGGGGGQAALAWRERRRR
jgi:hypothetical protein